ncbi:MAG: hypothetical protein GF398_00015 [Chitinivibrionales bacterium]|nr:hypothetical protein [Chitinivibrionales bacterium]
MDFALNAPITITVSGNKLCNISDSLAKWLDQYGYPSHWRSTQICSATVAKRVATKKMQCTQEYAGYNTFTISGRLISNEKAVPGMLHESSISQGAYIIVNQNRSKKIIY